LPGCLAARAGLLIHARARMCVCVCVCVCERAAGRTHVRVLCRLGSRIATVGPHTLSAGIRSRLTLEWAFNSVNGSRSSLALTSTNV